MRFGLRVITGTAMALAMFAGDIATLSLTPAAASAQFHGGGYHGGFGGYRGGYGGYHGYGGYRGYSGFGRGYGGYGGYYGGGFGVGDALLGAAIIGGTAAIISSNNRRSYDEPVTVYQAYPPAYAPGYAPPVDYGAVPAEPVYTSHDPVEQCSRAAVGEAANHGDLGRVLSIDRVDGRENGARVLGTIEINRPDRDGNRSSVERAHFTCTADYGQVTAFRFG